MTGRVATAIGLLHLAAVVHGQLDDNEESGVLPVAGDKIYDAMYTGVDGAACVRLLTKDGEIGCSTDGRISGVLRLYDEAHQAVLDDPPPGGDSVAIAIPQAMFNLSAVLMLESRLKLSGILVLNSGPEPESDSADELTPQSLMAKLRGQELLPWNPAGQADAIRYRRFGFAIVNVDEGSATGAVYDRARQNEDWARANTFQAFMAEFNYPMYAKQDSIACLSRATCLPVGGFSVWTTLDRLNATFERPVVLATAMMDASALFHDQAVGAASYQSGVASLLGTVQALNAFNDSLNDSTSGPECQRIDQLEKQIMAAFLQGEQFGYVGSRRLAKDLFEGINCEKWSHLYPALCVKPYKPSMLFAKLNLTRISNIIEIGEVGLIEDGRVYLHVPNPNATTPPREADRGPTDEFAALAQRVTQALNETITIRRASPGLSALPPSSIPSFLEAAPPSATTIASLQLADFNTSFRNRYFHSRYDRNVTVGDNLCHVARATARILYGAAGGNTSEACLSLLDRSLNCGRVKELFDCLTLNFGCDLVKRKVQHARQGPPSNYASVFFLLDPSDIGGVSKFLRGYLTEMLIEDNGFGATYHDAVDPVLEFDYPQDRWRIKSGESWSDNVSAIPSRVYTESNWASDVGTRLYRREDPEVQAIVLGLGIGLTFLTGVLGVFSKPYILQNFKT